MIKSLGLTAKLLVLAGTAMICSTHVLADVLNPVIGATLFEENFDTLDASRWSAVDKGDGFGNQELQYYRPANASVGTVPFEAGTSALIIEARREAFGGRAFTSAKITTENKVQVKYGMIEVRLSTPDLNSGLWPAAWLLGTSLATWPAKGEMDMMEMGHKAASRVGANGGPDINSFVGSNAIFYSPAACVVGNESCAASTAWQTQSSYVAPTPLTNRFVKYRLYWTSSQLRYTIIDNGVEHDMYNAPIPVGGESSELQAPFFLLLNLAVGGNFTDAAVDSAITAPLPAKMYVDYIRISQLDGLGEVKFGSQVVAEKGTYGVFTDNTPTTRKETLGTTSDFWIWNTNSMTAGTTPAYEGANVLALKYVTPNEWFGAGVASREAHDMSAFVDGNLKFRIKVPANVAFKVAVNDSYTNSNAVTFPANATTFGLVRNGDWAQATVPVATLRGSLIALQSMTQLFSIVSVDGQLPTAGFDMAIDDIVWECGNSAACQPTTQSSSPSSVASSVASSIKSSVASSVKSSVASSVASSVKSSVASSVASSVKSSVASSVQPSSKSSSSAAQTTGYFRLNATSIRFYTRNAPWVDLHYTINGTTQQNVRMIHYPSNNNNNFTVTGVPAGAVVTYSFTIGQTLGAIDTPWKQFTF